MRFLIPLRRLLVDASDLLKAEAFSRGPKAGHLYIKRVLMLAGGKRKYRYYYLNEVSRSKGRSFHDPENEHEHYLISELSTHHENLKGKTRQTIETGTDFLRGLFSFKKPLTVVAGTTFQARHVKPFIDKELEGVPPDGSSPMVRVAHALELIPDYLKDLVDPENVTDKLKVRGYSGLKDFQLNDNTEDTHGQESGEGLGGYMIPETGTLRIMGSAFVGSIFGEDTVGDRPKYGARLTIAESVVWHEFGHHVHYRLKNMAETDEHLKKVLGEWENGLPGKRISTYASKNEKEDFAEAFAAMLAHPDHMASECPERYVWMQKNVLKHMPSLEQTLDMPIEQLAWWNTKPLTQAALALALHRMKSPATPFHPYYSEQDQFYTINKDGRTLYMRFGPANKDEETNWKAVPDTIGKTTIDGQVIEVPKNEAGLGIRFRKHSSVKEIYDEHGRPLSDHQAWLYLGQDEEAVNKKVGAKPDEYVQKRIAEEAIRQAAEAEASVGEKKKRKKSKEEKKADLDLLSEKLYTYLGYNKDIHNAEAERQRLIKVKQAQDVWDAISAKPEGERNAKEQKLFEKGRPDFLLPRHEWVPVEITATEFIQKSGTFKFGNIRAAAEQPYVAKDAAGRTILRADGAPALRARVYEQENPDGTKARIVVNEEAPFARGDVVLLPTESGGWAERTLTSDDPTDPYALARQYKTSAKRLLERNGKLGRYQIADPIMASLINPSAKPITDSSMLQEMLRDSAQLRSVDPLTGDPYVGRRAWITVGGSDPNGPVSHIQLQWDGSGPPRVVGNYYQRKLNSAEQVRIDQLLTDKDTLDIPEVREVPPKEVPATIGNSVWVVDPKSKRRALGTLVNKRETKDGTVYTVEPLVGQPGIAPGAISTTSIETTRTDLVESNPDLRKRFVEPLQKDVLLYLDEVPREGGPETKGRGIIRISLPKDESVTLLELQKMPGVRIGGDKGDDIADISISIEDLPAFRNRIGGFVMEAGVLQKLQDADIRTRVMAEEAGKTQVVEASDLEDKHGNINPDGPLNGLVLGNAGIQPGAHRISALQALAKYGGRLYAAHFMGTGKTALAIMAGQMMRNLRDPSDASKLHPNAVKKKVLNVVPKQTAENWFREYVRFKAPPTLLGSGTLSGAQQLPTLPARVELESEDAYKTRAIADWKEQVKANPKLWNPWSDSNDDAVISMEYFRDNEEALRFTGLFDGLVVDEAQKIQRVNQLSRAVERWSPNMNLFLLMSGTPITNTLAAIPRLVELVTGGAIKLGSIASFATRYLLGSSVLKRFGRKNPPKTDLNPLRAGELASTLQPLFNVATSADVKGKSMPAVLLDENQPAHMTGQQARMYRAAGAALTEDEREALSASAALGLDEASLLKENARRKVQVMRSISNSPAYKAPDQFEYATYKTTKTALTEDGKVKVSTVDKAFELPSLETLTGKPPLGWGGKWPDESDAEGDDATIEPSYLEALHKHMENVLGVAYEHIKGRRISETKQGKKLIEALRKTGSFQTNTGDTWHAGEGPTGGGRLRNPDYGPEGMTCRGVLDETSEDGDINPVVGRWFNAQTEKYEEIVVPVGTKFIRDPNAKAAGLFYAEDDWDKTGRFKDTGEGGVGTDEGDEEGGKTEGEKEVDKEGGQGPKKGREGWSIQRHPERRKERAMFDLAVTVGNAKCNRMEDVFKNIFKEKTGSGASEQMIIFGKMIGSSVRTAEAKLRTMGYMDVNEAMGHSDWSSEGDKKHGLETRKFFVSYMGPSATLGDRDLNSEIFRRQQDEFGKDTGTSMLVWRSLYGSEALGMPQVGEIRAPWGNTHREVISKTFVDGFGKTKKDGSRAGMEVPLRVTGKLDVHGKLTQAYVYESDLPKKTLAEIKSLELQARVSRGSKLDSIDAKINALIEPYWVDRKPLSDHQIDIMNNCQVMVASDAAQVGLNWPSNHLIMYDSLFSPMEEWQRIARAARMLPPAIRGAVKPLTMKIGAYIAEQEAKNEFKEYEGVNSAILIVKEAITNALTTAERNKLVSLSGGAPEQIMESWFAQRALDKIRTLREPIGASAKKVGIVPDTSRPTSSENFIPPEAVQESDIVNVIIRQHLTPFDKEILKSRRYLVDVKRLTTSVDTPVFKTFTVTDPETGKKKKKRKETGEFRTESPVMSDKAQLAQGRAKMVANEYFLHTVQNAQPVVTRYDYQTAQEGSLAGFSELADRPVRPIVVPVKKSLTHRTPRFVVRLSP